MRALKLAPSPFWSASTSPPTARAIRRASDSPSPAPRSAPQSPALARTPVSKIRSRSSCRRRARRRRRHRERSSRGVPPRSVHGPARSGRRSRSPAGESALRCRCQRRCEAHAPAPRSPPRRAAPLREAGTRGCGTRRDLLGVGRAAFSSSLVRRGPQRARRRPPQLVRALVDDPQCISVLVACLSRRSASSVSATTRASGVRSSCESSAEKRCSWRRLAASRSSSPSSVAASSVSSS